MWSEFPRLDAASPAQAEAVKEGTTARLPRRSLRHGPYVWGAPIGYGGMARVHHVFREGDFRKLAAKRIRPEYAGKPKFVSMFEAEAMLSATLEHPNLVQAVDFGEQDGELVLVMEYVDGVSCGQMLRAAAARGGSLPLPVALYVATEVLKGLEYAHTFRGPDGTARGIVHRDVSPGNILIGVMGDVKLTDFGVACSNDAPRHARPGALEGKFGYMSPEQIGGWPLDGRSDLFSLGIVLFEMVSGRPLFPGNNDFEVLARTYEADMSALVNPRAGLPLELRLVLAMALARDPDERFQRAVEFREALATFARHAGIDLEPRPLIEWLREIEIWPEPSGRYAAPGPEQRVTEVEDELPEAGSWPARRMARARM